MKKTNILIFTIISCFLFYFSANAVPDSCLKMIYPNDGINWMNQDSIKADSCFDSPTFHQWYSKYGYEFGIANYPFLQKPITETDRKNWRDIDSQYSLQRSDFQMLEEKFGEFTIRRLPERTDSMHIAHPVFIIDFVDYQLVDSVIFYVSLIDRVYGCNLSKFPHALSVQGYNYNNDNFEIIITQSLLTIVFADNYLSKLNSNQIRIEIFNLTGKRVKNIKLILNKSIEIDMSDFVPGIYFLKIDNNFVKYIKF